MYAKTRQYSGEEQKTRNKIIEPLSGREKLPTYWTPSTHNPDHAIHPQTIRHSYARSVQ